MSVYTFKPVTETSWILLEDGNKVAVAINNSKGLMLMGGNFDRSSFSDVNDLSTFLGSKISIETTDDDSVEEVGDLDGYPVKHKSAMPVTHESLPLYKKTASSNTIYSAGYYGIKFTHGWVTSYCPKASTVLENEYIGPFTTKLEMQNAISQKKKEIAI